MIAVNELTVLFDPECPLCRSLRRWLERQPVLVRLRFVAAGSAEARRLYPGLDHAATLEEITVIGDGGQVYAGPAAWIAVLWSLRAYRATAKRLATPLGMPLARASVLAAAKIRSVTAGGAGSTTGGAGPARGAGSARGAAVDGYGACDESCRAITG